VRHISPHSDSRRNMQLRAVMCRTQGQATPVISSMATGRNQHRSNTSNHKPGNSPRNSTSNHKPGNNRSNNRSNNASNHKPGNNHNNNASNHNSNASRSSSARNKCRNKGRSLCNTPNPRTKKPHGEVGKEDKILLRSYKTKSTSKIIWGGFWSFMAIQL